MKKKFSIIIITLLILMHPMILVHGQNFIGMHKEDIGKVLRQSHPNFRLDNTTVNNTYNYLKFVDKISEQTILFFLSDNDICTYVRWISDYSNLNDMVDMLNQKYGKKAEKSWMYTERGKRYSIKLEEEEWYFTINIKEE